MSKRLVSISMLLILLISTIPLILDAKPIEASITGPSLIVNDAANQIYATLGAMAGSAVTVKGTVTNLAVPNPEPWLTAVLYRENGGLIIPPDLTLFWSLDGITWWPAGPVNWPTAYPGYQLELIVGAPNYWFPPSFSTTTYIKTIANRPLLPTDVEVIVFVDANLNQVYDPGELIRTIPPPAYDFPVKIDLSIWNTAELDPAMFFSTIQAAINAATPGQTIYVYPGIYPESINIWQALTITGDPGDAFPGPGPNAPILDGSTLGNAIPAVTIAQGVSNVVFEGFEIRNYGTSGNTNEDGVSVWNSGTFNIRVSDNYIHHVGYDGILVGNGWGGPQGLHSGWVIARNIIKNFGAYAIDLENAEDSLVANNEISNPTYTTTYGIVVTSLGCGTNSIDMSNVTVSGNNITNYPDRAMTVLAWTSAAGATSTLRDVNVVGNTITGSFNAILAWRAGPGTNILRDITITDNDITINNPKAANYIVDLADAAGSNNLERNNMTLTGTIGGGGTFFHAVNIGGPPTGTWTITGNRLNGNNVGAASCGFRLRGTLPATAVLNLRNNIITGWANGIRSDALAGGTQVNVHYNNIAGNSANGVLNGAGAMIDARFNWWGDASGPTHSSNTGGTGDAISDNVDYSPWLGNPFEIMPRIYHVNLSGAPGAIQETIDEASPGDTIIVHDGTYNEAIKVDKTLTIQSASRPIIQPDNTTPLYDGGIRRVAIYITADNVIIRGFEIDGTQGTVHYGIYGLNTDGLLIEDNVIHNITNEIGAPGYDVAGVGILIFGWDDTVNNNIIHNNTVYNTGRMGIFIGGMESTYYKWLISSGNTISGNEVYNTWLGPTNDAGAAVQLNGAKDSSILGNDIHDTANNNRGIYIYGSAGGSANILTCNNVYNNARGILFWIEGPWVDWTGNTPAAPVVHYNNIYNNPTYGLYNYIGGGETVRVVDARYNWWGSASGPTHPSNPGGTGDVVSDNVSFAPWLLQEKVPPLVHDIAVISVVPNATMVYAGDIVRIDVIVENQGNTYETFNVTAYYDSNPIDSQTITDLVPGTNTTLTFYWNTTGMSAGNYTVKAVADVVLGEIDTADNTYVDGTVEILTVKRDITVISVTPDAPHQYPGRIVNITVVVKNNGEVPETFNVTAYRDSIQIGTIQVDNLGVGENATLIFSWNTSGLTPCYNWTISAEAPLVGDANPGDNTLTDGTVKIKMLGDLNADGIIDIFDIVLAAAAFGSTPINPEWNPQADLVQDGLIDVFDLVVIGFYFGEICP